MNRVLFVCGEYYPFPSANGVCVEHIQKTLYSLGIYSDVICLGKGNNLVKKVDFGNVYSISTEERIVPDVNKNLGYFLKKFRTFITWPIRYPSDIRKYKKEIKHLNKINQYAAIIGVLRPIEGAMACAGFDKFIIYELDSISNNGDNLYGIKHFLRYRAFNLEKYLYKKAKKVIHLRCHQNYYEQKKYEKYYNKFVNVDIPHIIDSEVKKTRRREDKKIRLIYTGSLDKIRNSPQYSIRILKELAKEMDIECRFFSRGNCEEELQNAQRSYPGIVKKCGYVDTITLDNEITNSDFLLSIGFHHTGTVRSIPSKIFTYMATGMPIIHIYGGDNDSALEYFDVYKNALIIYPNKGMQHNVEEIKLFINDNIDKRIPVDDIKKKLPMNTPEYTAEKIIEVIYEMEE